MLGLAEWAGVSLFRSWVGLPSGEQTYVFQTTAAAIPPETQHYVPTPSCFSTAYATCRHVACGWIALRASDSCSPKTADIVCADCVDLYRISKMRLYTEIHSTEIIYLEFGACVDIAISCGASSVFEYMLTTDRVELDNRRSGDYTQGICQSLCDTGRVRMMEIFIAAVYDVFGEDELSAYYVDLVDKNPPHPLAAELVRMAGILGIGLTVPTEGLLRVGINFPLIPTRATVVRGVSYSLPAYWWTFPIHGKYPGWNDTTCMWSP